MIVEVMDNYSFTIGIGMLFYNTISHKNISNFQTYEYALKIQKYSTIFIIQRTG